MASSSEGATAHDSSAHVAEQHHRARGRAAGPRHASAPLCRRGMRGEGRPSTSESEPMMSRIQARPERAERPARAQIATSNRRGHQDAGRARWPGRAEGGRSETRPTVPRRDSLRHQQPRRATCTHEAPSSKRIRRAASDRAGTARETRGRSPPLAGAVKRGGDGVCDRGLRAVQTSSRPAKRAPKAATVDEVSHDAPPRAGGHAVGGSEHGPSTAPCSARGRQESTRTAGRCVAESDTTAGAPSARATRRTRKTTRSPLSARKPPSAW